MYTYMPSYNMTAAWAVDQEFVEICLAPLVSFGRLWGPVKRLWACFVSFGVPLGSLCASFANFGRLCSLLVALGCLWGDSGVLWDDF